MSEVSHSPLVCKVTGAYFPSSLGWAGRMRLPFNDFCVGLWGKTRICVGIYPEITCWTLFRLLFVKAIDFRKEWAWMFLPLRTKRNYDRRSVNPTPVLQWHVWFPCESQSSRPPLTSNFWSIHGLVVIWFAVIWAWHHIWKRTLDTAAIWFPNSHSESCRRQYMTLHNASSMFVDLFISHHQWSANRVLFTGKGFSRNSLPRLGLYGQFRPRNSTSHVAWCGWLETHRAEWKAVSRSGSSAIWNDIVLILHIMKIF